MLDYLIVGIFTLIAIIGIYFAFKSKGENTPGTNCFDEPIDYILNDD